MGREQRTVANRDLHAAYRTLLAEKRTALAELQMAILLITLPLTVHTGLTVLATRHQIVAQLHLLIPFWGILAGLLLAGLFTGASALRRLRALNRALTSARPELGPHFMTQQRAVPR